MKKIEQKNFWQGKFGDKYFDRNQDDTLLASNIYFFLKYLKEPKDLILL